MRKRVLDGTSEQVQPPSRLTLSAWLRAGEEWFSAEKLSPFRDEAKSRLTELRAEALAKAASFDAEMRALDKPGAFPPFLATFGKEPDAVPQGARPLPPPKRSARSAAKASVPKLVLDVVTANQGATSGTIIAQVQALKPGADNANIHSALYRLSKEEGPLRREGTQGNYTFFLKETPV